MDSPHVFFPTSFDAILSTDSVINTTYYIAIDTPLNSIRVQGNISTLDFSPRTFIDIYADLRKKQIFMLRGRECKNMNIPTNVSLPIVGGIFNTLPLITFYPKSQPRIGEHHYMFSNPFGKGQQATEVTLVFDEVTTEAGELDFPFNKLVLSKVDKLESEIQFKALQRVTEREFTEEDFTPTTD
mmetsp:Transcript_25509/g.28341  ORF Transcript_25509/g.28341 Transcript_25509/m.28341 type:complete len:184 (-) Transcript_25509:100-651(-)